MSYTSQHFTGTGSFDGFAHYGGMEYVDVSSYSNVYPLTLQQAMKVHWLYAQLNCTASAKLNAASAGTPFQLFSSIEDVPLGTMTGSNNGSGPSAPVKEPYERNCGGSYYLSDSIYNEDNQSGGTAISRIGVRIIPTIQRLYDGATDDPDNFIGWGLEGATTSGSSGFPFEITAATGGFGGGLAQVQFGSYMHPFGTPSSSERVDDRKLTLDVDGEDIDFRMRQKLRLTGLSGSTDRTYTFTDSGCEAKSVYSSTGTTFQHCKIDITGIDVFSFS